ncbi:MAG TPA: hypothetical protein VM451_00920 [Candidatus Limnocylindria bacterium]|nr:hypothetical protein [Candidatus Limnocylindria bacterium]
MRASWPASMWSALAASLGRPDWWALALAGFLVRGGLLLLILPIVSLPSPASIANLVAPTIESLGLGGLTPERGAAAVLIAASAALLVAIAGTAGAWFDAALLRETTADEDLAVGWSPTDTSPRGAFGIRLAAHAPTLLLLGYAVVRLIYATYDELLSPGDPAVPIVARVIGRAPETVVLVLLAWLAGESVGGLAVRRHAAGIPTRQALGSSARQLVSRRGLATLVLTTLVVGAVAAPFAWLVGNAWEHLRSYLAADVTDVQLGAALLVLVAAWILGIAVLGAVLAWRSVAWTVEVGTSRDRNLGRPSRHAGAERAPVMLRADLREHPR